MERCSEARGVLSGIQYRQSAFGDRVVPHPRLFSQFVKGRILSQSISRNKNIKTGEPTIDLRITCNFEGQQLYFNTRRVIHQTFVDLRLDHNNDGLYIINIDGNGFNNRVENLKAVTKSEKQKRAFRRERIDSILKTADRSNWKMSRTSSKPIMQFLNDELVASYNSIAEAVRKTGYGEKEIIMAAKGRREHYHGFVWKYSK